jgi:colicin import membrane protein
MTLSPRHLGLAALLHLALFILLFTGVQCSRHIETPPVVQGVLINPSQIPRPPQPNQPPQPKPQEDQGPQPKVNAEEVAEQAKQEQKKQEEQEQQRKQAEAAEAEKQKEIAEQKQKEEEDAIALKKKQEQEETERKAQQAAEAAKQAEDLKKQEAQEEQKRQQAILEEKKKEEAAKLQAQIRKQAEADLQAQLGAESGVLTAQVQDEWKVQLEAAIKRAWGWPAGSENRKAYVRITLANSGQVLSVRITNSSGAKLFDDSLLTAVNKASPLPLPKDMSAFDPNIEACFSPNDQNCQ